MNVPVVRKLVLGFSRAEIDGAVQAFEKDRSNPLGAEGANDGEIMSNLLAAQFVRHRLDNGMDINAAFREYGQRVKGILGNNGGNGGPFGGKKP
jgi:hypothetical protein